ncbi:MAG TPA: SDR family oxidoreductase [Solirubrobacteraceae bacterium]|nr:SDR family oxidoreductase [Solirubrobacteraceae bacterium]
MRRFAGKRALVTGAGSGIGRAVARRLAAEGAAVVGFDSSAAGLEETFGDAPDARRVVDVATSEGLRALIGAGPADVLVNAAGVLIRHGVLEHPLEDWNRTLEVNLKAPFRLSREFARGHVRRGTPATIVNVCSIESFVALAGHAAYTASKSGLLMLTRAFALELAPHRIRVNGIAPGVTETGMNAAMRADPDAAGTLASAIPMGRFADPEEQAAGICFLASEEASYITGAVLRIDGGWLTR